VADIKAFLREQERIYRERFRQQEAVVRREGFKPDPVVTGEKGGFLVVFLPDFTTRFWMPMILSLVGDELARCGIPHIRYTANPFRYLPANVHSTISDYNVADGYVPFSGTATNRAVDSLLVTNLQFAVRKAVRSLPVTTREQCAVQYRMPLLCNSTTVIAPGTPNEEWLIVVERIIERCASAGIELRRPWGAHMTLARFTEAVEPKKVRKSLSLVRGIQPSVTLRPHSIGVGTFTFNARDGFRANWLHKIRLY